jgi:uncharacterized protein (TIGR00725 family)
LPFDEDDIMQVAVIGGAECGDDVRKTAYELGKKLAKEGHVLICGGLGGVMEAVCCGAKECGGAVVGILPGEKEDANPWVSIQVATGMGHARNVIIVKSADVVIALPGEYGTLSEVALALKMGKRVISLKSWAIPGTIGAKTADEVVMLLQHMNNRR